VDEWFSLAPNRTQQITEDRCHAFLHALLSTALCHLDEICDEECIDRESQGNLATLASLFWDRMAKGRTVESHGTYRTKFYDAVFEQANEVMLPSFSLSQNLVLNIMFRM
jgi:hypothetical protein